MLHKIDVDQKTIAFMWFPWHVGIWENEAVDRAAEEAVNKEWFNRWMTLCPFQT